MGMQQKPIAGESSLLVVGKSIILQVVPKKSSRTRPRPINHQACRALSCLGWNPLTQTARELDAVGVTPDSDPILVHASLPCSLAKHLAWSVYLLLLLQTLSRPPHPAPPPLCLVCYTIDLLQPFGSRPFLYHSNTHDCVTKEPLQAAYRIIHNIIHQGQSILQSSTLAYWILSGIDPGT